uniref:Retrotransposon gag domain-containing protein n=1 Tax=Ananas comosus var. bracteatus TaxID=296719 RepID=A0A6V7Q076_ANACO|nr:unnamed protein product [Ananas comosus var. bracteatus]
MFDGIGDPREHLTHFEAACGDTVTNGSLLLRQFPLSLKVAAFQWYSKLPPGSIQDWPMMKAQFKSHFVSTKREITLRELADLKQERDEKVETYITRWKNTSINCSQEIRAEEAIRLCIGGMHPWLAVQIISKTPRSFQSLSQTAAELEAQYRKSPELLAMYKGFSSGDKTKKPQPTKSASTNEVRKANNPSAKGFAVSKLFRQALKSQRLTLPNPARPEQVNKTDDPLYCPYHRFVGHTIEDCITFKDWLEKVVKNGVFALSPKVLNTLEKPEVNSISISPLRVSCNMASIQTLSLSDSDDEVLLFPQEATALNEDVLIYPRNFEADGMELRKRKQLSDPPMRQDKEKQSESTLKPPQKHISAPHGKKSNVDYNVIAHLKRIPALLSVFDALMMAKELREALVEALLNPEPYETVMAEIHLVNQVDEEVNQITFSEEDFMTPNHKHNRPLYVQGHVKGVALKRILVDPGSVVNILPLQTLRVLGHSVDDLEPENVVISGFNKSDEHTLGSIQLMLSLQELKTLVRFYVIDADTSYTMLLGRPWIHEFQIVPSTLHQCLKYKDEHGRQKRISGNPNPFSWKLSHYADAQFFLEAAPSSSRLAFNLNKKKYANIPPPAYNLINASSFRTLQQEKNVKRDCRQNLNDPILLGSDSEDESSTHFQTMAIFVSKVPDELQNFSFPLPSRMSTTIEDVCVRVIRSTIPGRKPILLYKTSKAVRYSEPFPLEEDEEMSTVAMVKDDRLKHLLRQVGMQVTNEGRLPPTPSIFEKLWVPSNNMQDVEARRRRQGLGYVEPLLKWPCSSCNHTTVVLGDSSESDDEELLLWPIDNCQLQRCRVPASPTTRPQFRRCEYQLHQLLDSNSNAAEYQLHQLLDSNSNAAEYQLHQLLDLNFNAAVYQLHQLLDLNPNAAEYQLHQLLYLNYNAAEYQLHQLFDLDTAERTESRTSTPEMYIQALLSYTLRHSIHRAFYAHRAIHAVINFYYVGSSSTKKRRLLVAIPTPLLTAVALSSLIPEWCTFPFASVASSSTKEVVIHLLLLRRRQRQRRSA